MNPSELARVSAGLQKQVTRDLAPVWEVSATVDPFPSLEDVPAGYWPVVLTFRDLGGEAGIHVDSNGQPYALIEMSPSWSLTASHVCLEMLTDPFGGRTFPGVSPRPDQGDVEFMGGICDACEHPDNAYLVNDVLVSDFCTPAFWERSSPNTERRSFTGAVEASLQVLPGGHLSWYDPATNSWWLRRHADGALSDIKVGVANPQRGTVREFIAGHVPHLESTKMTLEAFEARSGVPRQRAFRASQSRAYWLRASVENLQRDDAVRAVLGAARSPRDISNGRQALSALLRMSLGTPGPGGAGEGTTEARRVPDAPGAADVDDQTIVVDESVFEQDAARRAGERVSAHRPRRYSPRDVDAMPNPRYVQPTHREARSESGDATEAIGHPPQADSTRGRTNPPPLPPDAPLAQPRVEIGTGVNTGVSAAPSHDPRTPPGSAVTLPYAPPSSEPTAEVHLPPMPTPRIAIPTPPTAGRANAIPPGSVPPANQGASLASRLRGFGLGVVAATVVIAGLVFIRTSATSSAPSLPATLHEAPESTSPTSAAPASAAAPANSAAPVPAPTPAASVAGARTGPAPAVHALHPAIVAPVQSPPPRPATFATPAIVTASAPVAVHPASSAASIDSLVDDRR